MSAVKLQLERVVITSAAQRELEAAEGFQTSDLAALLVAHRLGDWGDVDAHDRTVNDEAVLTGDRILSSYLLHCVKLWVISDPAWDREQPQVRQVTTILRPADY